ncbi:hypothetical protein [Desulfosporosinus youngiae]|uniref:Uncharacterized protein n=1 Tax=Desulfosporosinus youngiae DSM 17734 TaxID=768710 RepID=H5Y528_9FIRM|nr:hypothetical protein [Desulfosporosinus youngiae]EHQ90132.1 hypothetical protein DesyoDRAFT_3095 [Desulfosporosinus youngiae DSM 17734]
MLCKKKIIAQLFTVMLCMLTSPLASYASADNVESQKASLYIRSTSVTAQAIGNGTLLLENMLGATRIVDQLGVKTIEVQTLRNGYWQSIYTIVRDDYLYNTGTYVYDCYYYGTPGTQYRSYVEFYVADDGGSETKIVTSNPVTAY